MIWSAKTDICLYVRLYKGHGCSTKCEKRFWSFYFLQTFHQNDISHPSINLWHVSQVWMVTFIAFSYVILCYNDERAFLITKCTQRLLPIPYIELLYYSMLILLPYIAWDENVYSFLYWWLDVKLGSNSLLSHHKLFSLES